MRHGSRQDSGSRHSADTLRSSSGVAEGGSPAGGVDASSCESREEGKSCDDEDGGCEDEHSSWEDEQRSWEELATERVESDWHCEDGGVLAFFPSGRSMPSDSRSEPSRYTIIHESVSSSVVYHSRDTAARRISQKSVPFPSLVQQGALAPHQRDPSDLLVWSKFHKIDLICT